ncbi:MAG: M20/M25/M40 family metallo-hydrolase, partial [Oscillospiraceae bacterium]
MNITDKIIELSNSLEQHTLEIRRKIHSNPELSFKEFETSKLVCQELDRIGIPYEKSPVEPGIIATIDTQRPGKFVMLRADMDALPLQETADLPFASKNANVMHACGHDVHTSNLLAVGEILNSTKEMWNGKVKLVFQPAE